MLMRSLQCFRYIESVKKNCDREAWLFWSVGHKLQSFIKVQTVAEVIKKTATAITETVRVIKQT